jgi:hypothetical protein
MFSCLLSNLLLFLCFSAGGGGESGMVSLTADPDALSYIFREAPWDHALRGPDYRAKTTPINFELSITRQ